MIDAKRRIAGLACARQQLNRQDDRLRRRIAELSREREVIERACEEQRARVQEVDQAVVREQSRIDAMTRNGRPFSIDMLMQANRCVDSFVQARAALMAKLDRLIEQVDGKESEMAQVRRAIVTNQFRDTIYAQRIEVIRNDVAVIHARRVDEETDEAIWMRRVTAARIDE
ncbi:hypothetical protein BGV47_24640 [Burkholderia ubonensis]|uniref:hypothetical protein n=1 Tax=Burkholderia ubonensis TaxID=101571 RepID=UPI0008FE8D31|nr:hypothetical protein [Burkholderia ubonensis]OJA31024.1 hypothetical protein BGV47_24640 [Burkholderia ubonensis]OJB28191.1 hypothetical protein BGV55_17650 [Burkholderia ubonensis]